MTLTAETSAIPYWTSESPITHAYVAEACPHMPDPMGDQLTAGAKLFRVATDNFISHMETQEPLRLDHLNFTTDRAWEALACQMRERYRRSHYRLINEDNEYTDTLGEINDAIGRLNGARPPKANETAASRRRRHRQEVHHAVVSEATDEGIPTAVAAYGVVPFTVRLREPDTEPAGQLQTATDLLPAAHELSRHLARHSRLGNERILHALADLPIRTKINYGKLSYNPQYFDYYRKDNRQVLHTVGDYREPEDLEVMNRFRGCPALLFGSVRQINRSIERAIQRNNLYARAIPGSH